MAKGLVVSEPQRGIVRGLLDDAPNDKCFACIAPRIQVACVDGACVGAPVALDAGVVEGLDKDHCGTLGAPVARAWQRAPLGCGGL